MATFSLLGPVFAVFRPLAAFLAGMFGGILVDATAQSHSTQVETTECTNHCCSHNAERSKLAQVFHYGFVTLPRDIASPLIIGLVIAGAISALVPTDFFAESLGTGIGAMLVMMAVGIPIYVCATASIPVAAAMMLKGVTPGAALVFLMTGPATNVAAIASLWTVLGRRTTLIYLTSVVVMALASGLALDFLFDITGASVGQVEMWMLPHWVKTVCAIVLLSVLVTASISKHRSKKGSSCAAPRS